MPGLHAPHDPLHIIVVQVGDRIAACRIGRNPPTVIQNPIYISMAGIVDQDALVRRCIHGKIPHFIHDRLLCRLPIQKQGDLKTVTSFKQAGKFPGIVHGGFQGRNLLVLVVVDTDHQRPVRPQLPAFMAQILFALDLNTTLRLELTGNQKETGEGEEGDHEFEP